MIKNLSNSELVLHVDNKPSATELERELADRLEAALKTLAALHRAPASTQEAIHLHDSTAQLEAFAKIVSECEREACAKIAEPHWRTAEAIRARGGK